MPEIVRTIEKQADQTVANNTPVSDTKLLLNMLVSDIWKFRFFIGFNISGATSGIKFRLTGPAAPTNLKYHITIYDANGVFATVTLNAYDTDLVAAILVAGDYHAEIEGTVENGANAGNLVMQFAQNVTDGANPVAIRRGSSLEYLPAIQV